MRWRLMVQKWCIHQILLAFRSGRSPSTIIMLAAYRACRLGVTFILAVIIFCIAVGGLWNHLTTHSPNCWNKMVSKDAIAIIITWGLYIWIIQVWRHHVLQITLCEAFISDMLYLAMAFCFTPFPAEHPVSECRALHFTVLHEVMAAFRYPPCGTSKSSLL